MDKRPARIDNGIRSGTDTCGDRKDALIQGERQLRRDSVVVIYPFKESTDGKYFDSLLQSYRKY